MDRFEQINRILDACLTTELINQVYPPLAFQKDRGLALPEKKARHRLAQIKIMEKAGSVLQRELGTNLQDKELALFCERIDAFLSDHGFDVRTLL